MDLKPLIVKASRALRKGLVTVANMHAHLLVEVAVEDIPHQSTLMVSHADGVSRWRRSPWWVRVASKLF